MLHGITLLLFDYKFWQRRWWRWQCTFLAIRISFFHIFVAFLRVFFSILSSSTQFFFCSNNFYISFSVASSVKYTYIWFIFICGMRAVTWGDVDETYTWHVKVLVLFVTRIFFLLFLIIFWISYFHSSRFFILQYEKNNNMDILNVHIY